MRVIIKVNPGFAIYSDGVESLLVEQRTGRLSGLRRLANRLFPQSWHLAPRRLHQSPEPLPLGGYEYEIDVEELFEAPHA